MVQALDIILDVDKAVVKASSLQEGRLGWRDDGLHYCCEAYGEDLGDQLGYRVDQADRSEITDAVNSFFLGDQRDDRRV